MSKALCRHSLLKNRKVLWFQNYRHASTCNRISHYSDVKYRHGDKIHGYTVTRVTPADDLKLCAFELVHDKTKARHVHIARPDSDNVFSVAFPTPPPNSCGVTHVLEHVSLCGSNKYPCRDPFFHMQNRSMATFMNAWTAGRYTMYPFSTQNEKDYDNLMSVYLDAAFYPKLTELDFLQEGWRLEHEDPTNKDTPLAFKGIVWNEMKGDLSNSDKLFYARKLQSLFGDGTADGSISGGEPSEILDKLTWKGLREYHSKYYHPSNSLFYTYGDMSLERHLELINEEVLSKFEPKVVAQDYVTRHWDAAPSSNNEFIEAYCAQDPMLPVEKQTKMSVNWGMSKADSVYEHFARRVFSSLLIEGPSSPMYKALLTSQIASDYSPSTGYDPTLNIPVFSVGVVGIDRQNVNDVKKTILETLKKVSLEGFEEENIEGILHQYELDRQRQGSSFGLNLGAGLMGFWCRGYEIPDLLNMKEYTQRIRDELKSGQFVNRMINKELFDNELVQTFVLSPDQEYAKKIEEQETQQLVAVVSALSPEEKEKIYQNGLDLMKSQETPSDTSCLPLLKIEELETELPEIEVENDVLKIGSNEVSVQYCSQPTNTVYHMKVLFDANNISPHLKPYLPLFSNLLPHLGAGERDNIELRKCVKLWTGGLNFASHSYLDGSDPKKSYHGMILSSYALSRNIDNMYDLINDTINSPQFQDPETISTLLNMIYSEMGNSVVDQGHNIAMLRASASLSEYNAQKEMFSGVSQIPFMKKLVADIDNQSPMLIMALTDIANEVFSSKNVKVAINSDLKENKEVFARATAGLEKFLSNLPENPIKSPNESILGTSLLGEQLSQKKTYISWPVNTHFTSLSLPGLVVDDPHISSTRLLVSMMSSKFLHREIREKGGAYGGGCVTRDGVLSFYSYRDPNVHQTFEAYDNSIKWALNSEFKDSDINEAKLALLQQMDKPVPPSGRGLNEFMYGDTYEKRQRRRDLLFAADRNSINEAAQSLLSPSNIAEKASRAVIGPESHTSDYTKDWFTV